MNEQTYVVKGMTCGGCSSSVTKAAQRAAPEAEVKADHQTDSLHVRGNHDPAALAKAVEDAGFDWVGA